MEILKIGITGGIASGKSVVLDELRKFEDGVVLDADRVARETYRQGNPAYESLVDLLGNRILDEEGRIDRKKLAEKIYEDSEIRNQVEEIIHPRVEERFREIAAEACREDAKFVALEAPLIFQSDYVDSDLFDVIVLVDVKEEEQLERLEARYGISKELALKIIDIQGFDGEIKKKADHVISSAGTQDDTRRRAKKLFERLFDFV